MTLQVGNLLNANNTILSICNYMYSIPLQIRHIFQWCKAQRQKGPPFLYCWTNRYTTPKARIYKFYNERRKSFVGL